MTAAPSRPLLALPLAPTLLAGGLALTALTIRLQGLVPLGEVGVTWWLLYLGVGYIALAALFWLRPAPPGWADRLSTGHGFSGAQLALLPLSMAFAGVARLAAGEELLARDWQMAAAAWILSIAAVVLATIRPGERLSPPRPGWRPVEIAAVAGLLLLALFLRATALDGYPANLSGDEGSAGLEAVKFVQGTANNVLALGWFAFPTFYFWVQSLGIELAGQTTAGLRLLSALAGTLTVPALYWLVRSLYGRATAFFAAALLAASHYHIHFSRIGLNNIWDGLFAVLALGCLWRGWRGEGRLWFVLCGLLVGVGQYFYVSMRIFPLIILLWAGAAFFLDRPRLRRRFPDFVVTAVVSLVVFLPLIMFYVNHPDQFNAPLQRVSIFNGWLEQEVALRQTGPMWIWLDQVRKAVGGLTHIDLRHWYAPEAPLLLPPLAILFVVGLLRALWRLRLRELLVLLPLAAVVLMSSFSQDLPSAQRYVIASPLVLILAAQPLGWFFRRLARSPQAGPTAAAVLIGMVLTMLIGLDVNFYFREASEKFVLGGINTEVATAAAEFLQPYESSELRVYFLGAPRMTYHSHSTLPYLLPQAQGSDFLEPLTAPPPAEATGPTFFLFLPERFGEYDYVKQAHPFGTLQAINNARGELLFLSYAVNLEE